MSAGGTSDGAASQGGATDADVSGGASIGACGKAGQASMVTPRFTHDEKEILYSLFHQHEEVIDIKYRKRQRSKYSVRDAWDQIVREFNSHPGVSAVRNTKQIQKFWLNARLRKQYPFRSKSNSAGNSSGSAAQKLVDQAIKDEPDFQIEADSSDHNDTTEAFEEIEMGGSGVGQLEDETIDPQQQQQLQVQHQTQAASIQTQHISVDQISADKLTLDDLLHFKTARPRDEIILQIKHTDATGSQITLPSPTRITLPPHHQQPQQHTMATITASGYNQQIISEIKPQQITLAQYQAQQQQQLQQQQQQQLVQQQLVAAAAQQTQTQQVKMQLHSPATSQFTSTPNFTCATFTAVPAATATHTVAAASPVVAAAMNMETIEEKINYFKVKEAELRFKEQQVVLEKKKIELSRAQEELKHLREVHRLQVEELKMKIRILQEDDKRRNHSVNQ